MRAGGKERNAEVGSIEEPVSSGDPTISNPINFVHVEKKVDGKVPCKLKSEKVSS